MKIKHLVYLSGLLVIGVILFTGCRKKPLVKPDIPVSKPQDPAPVKPPKKLILGPVYFSFNSPALSKDARDQLYANAMLLKANPDVPVNVEGHCDQRGTNAYNLSLGEKRARAVMQYYLNLGVQNPMGHVSYGEEIPFCDEETEACYARNRRGVTAEAR